MYKATYKATYRKIDVNTVSQEDQISEHLLKAAKIITDFFVTPSSLLEFASETISRIDSYRRIKEDYSKDLDSYLEVLMINEIVQPWLKNGDNAQEKIAEGLKVIYEQYGTDYVKEIALIERTMDVWLDDFDVNYLEFKNLVLAIQSLYEVAPMLQAYEESEKKNN